MDMNIISNGTKYSLSVLVRLHWTWIYTKIQRFINTANLNFVAKEVLLLQVRFV